MIWFLSLPAYIRGKRYKNNIQKKRREKAEKYFDLYKEKQKHNHQECPVLKKNSLLQS